MMQSFEQKMKQALLVVVALVMVGRAATGAEAQQAGARPAVAGGGSAHPVDVGLSYDYVHTNILPGCNCFSLNGGGATVQVGVVPHLAAVADLTVATRSGITPDNYTLTQLTYTFGARYKALSPAARFQPFGEVLIGGAHAFGTLSPGNNAIGGSSNAIAFQAGGGVSVRVGSRFQLLPAQADYLLTNFHNDSANHQNELRLSAGIIIRLKR